MPTVINHRGINIFTLANDEPITNHCNDGDIAIVQDDAGWWTCFVGENGHVDRYDAPFDTYSQALGTAKAAAEVSSE
jgi:hypothetical protein